MKKIYLDVGHGGTDSGAVGVRLLEKDINLKIAIYTSNYLTENYDGLDIKLSRTTDITKSLSTRTKEANDWKADILVSIHCNATVGGTGLETFRYTNVTKNSENLQKAIHTELKEVYRNFSDRGMKKANFHMLRESKMPAVLTENLFIDNKVDAEFMRSEQNLKKIGQAHAVGIAKYLKLKERKKETNKDNLFYRVVSGSYSNKENAEKQVAELKAKGIDSFIAIYKSGE